MKRKNSLTPAELFDYRLAALHGWLDPEAMKAAMPYRVYLGWQKYWKEEPWGPWRDNMHAAIIAREVRRGLGGKLPDLSVWLMRDPDSRLREANNKVLAALGTVGTKVTPKEAKKKMRAHLKSRAEKRNRKR